MKNATALKSAARVTKPAKATRKPAKKPTPKPAAPQPLPFRWDRSQSVPVPPAPYPTTAYPLAQCGWPSNVAKIGDDARAEIADRADFYPRVLWGITQNGVIVRTVDNEASAIDWALQYKGAGARGVKIIPIQVDPYSCNIQLRPRG